MSKVTMKPLPESPCNRFCNQCSTYREGGEAQRIHINSIISPIKLFHQWGEVVHSIHVPPRTESHKLSEFASFGPANVTGCLQPALAASLLMADPNIDNIYLHTATFQNNILRFLSCSTDPQQMPAQYQEPEPTLHPWAWSRFSLLFTGAD